MESVNASQFKDFVVAKHSYHVNEELNDIKTISRLLTDKMHINGELKIIGIDIAIDKFSFLHTQCVRIELPTGDEISIPVSDNPWVGFDEYTNPAFNRNYPVFIEDEDKLELKWHKDLAAGEFYIMMDKVGKKEIILIRSIYGDRIDSIIEYTSCTSRHNRDKGDYFVETVSNVLTLECAKDYKFIPMKDVIS